MRPAQRIGGRATRVPADRVRLGLQSRQSPTDLSQVRSNVVQRPQLIDSQIPFQPLDLLTETLGKLRFPVGLPPAGQSPAGRREDDDEAGRRDSEQKRILASQNLHSVGPGRGSGLDDITVEETSQIARQARAETYRRPGAGLEVSMDEPDPVRGVHVVGYLRNEPHSLFQRQVLRRLALGFAIDVLHGDERAPVALADLVDLAYIGVVDASLSARFQQQTFDMERIVVVQQLESYPATELRVEGLEDLCGTACGRRNRGCVPTRAGIMA